MINETKCGHIAVLAVILSIIGVLAVLNIFVTPPQILYAERRLPDRMPEFSAQNLLSGEFMTGFENAASDAFPFREGFRGIRAMTVFGAFLQTDKYGVYFDAHGIGSFSHTNPDGIALAAEKIAAISAELSDLNIFYAFIPDKSYFSPRNMPGFDGEAVESILRERLDSEGLVFIPLADAMDADSFFRTDLHWCQVSIGGVLDALACAMDFELDMGRFSREYVGQFYGVYVGQLALPSVFVRSESMYVLENPDIAAFYLNMATRELYAGAVYDFEMFHGWDPYDIFLRGVQPLVVLENAGAEAERHLYVFRDSFASPLAPVLAAAYSRVTLIDLRFMDFRAAREILDFAPGSDVLFLYSSGILNNAEMLLVQV